VPQPKRRPRTKLAPGVDWFDEQDAKTKAELATPYVPKERLLKVGSDTEGPFPGLHVVIVALSAEQMLDLMVLKTYAEISRAIAPYVKQWNMTAKNPDTGEDVPLPPPAAAGAIVLDRVDQGVTAWLQAVLCMESLQYKHLTEATNVNKSSR
jgi:hypothetical protein